MKMHIIGTGTATVSKYINTSCVFEEDNQLFLVDGTGGSDILRAFDTMNLNWKKLHYAFLSHEHTDHFFRDDMGNSHDCGVVRTGGI